MNKSDNFDRGFRTPATTQERNRANLQKWCDLAVGMQAIRGQWKASILMVLSETESDIPALQGRLAVADRRVLVRALRELEKDRLVERSAGGTRYSLTSDGSQVIEILGDIARWQRARRKTGA
ncbi:winged helix-turn-helix transcriptional regulator [Tropicimonas sp. IMCC34043]|uniref:winged helix-turn-helix transcriptional regulator n=1 Tax=Tropicimonas sp. IMCC34043 TaxID=2248760 RepID=UPI000E27B221